MQQEFEWHLDAVAGAMTNKTLKAAAESVLASYGFERWVYAADNPYGMVGLPVTLSSGLGVWLLTYMTKGYQSVDPIVAHCRTAEAPLFWDSKEGRHGASDKEQSLMRDLVAHGLCSGVAIPLHTQGGPQGLINVIKSGSLAEERMHLEQVLPHIHRVGLAMHETMIKIMKVTRK